MQTTLGQKSGFGFYVDNLVKNIKKIDQSNQYVLIKPGTNKDLSTPKRIIWDQFGFPLQANLKRVDIIHQPCFSAPIFSFAKKVVTIHDLISMNFPENIPRFSRMFYSQWMPFTYRFADHYIAISKHTKKDILRLLKLDPSKITVIYEAADESYMPLTKKADLEKVAKVREKYKLPEKYILHIGTLEPRKNLIFLVKVFAEAIKDKKIPHSLAIAGKKGWYYEELFKLVDDLGLADRVIFTGYIDDEDKSYLYNGSSLFAFPSVYEGFGLPPLEAMSCGVPVMTSSTSSLPEVVDKAGVLLPPNNKNLWVRNMKRVLKSSKVQKEMSEASLIQAAKFSWQKTAEQTLEVYNKLTAK